MAALDTFDMVAKRQATKEKHVAELKDAMKRERDTKVGNAGLLHWFTASWLV